MNTTLKIDKTISFVKDKLYGEGSGHDWFHIERVYKTSLYLADKENANIFVVSLAALLHDIDDWKFSKDNTTNTTNIEAFLYSIDVDKKTIATVCSIIKTLSFKGGVVDSTQTTIEGKIVQDADRLDAIGAIGIARTFAYGGNKNRLMYDPSISPKTFNLLSDVKDSENHTINHFYEKLLKLKDLMNTKSGKELALERHDFMEKFLEQFYSEWDCNF